MGVAYDFGQLETDGFYLERRWMGESDLQIWRDEAERLQGEARKVCVRDILQRSEMVGRLAADVSLFIGVVPVRGILFDKTPESNWPVAWHQDLSIAVAERVDVEGYSCWTEKEGVAHVQPPVELLDQMVTLRIHLDETPAENGALRVVAESHRCGRMDAEAIAAKVEEGGEFVCEAEAGDALWMKPLILHASGRSERHSHRWVIHLEFAPADGLAAPLCWYEEMATASDLR